MRVLITNRGLEARCGSELYVRDLALALLARGHQPIAFSPRLGAVAAELRGATVPVIADLDLLGQPPDVIHGQHHLETMAALLRFPGVPAVFFCHGWIPWDEAPPRFPRILRYVAVDDTCRDRVVSESGIDPERVEVVLNFVDLDRFRPRGPLPARPRRALVFSNAASEATQLPPIRDACARLGIDLQVAGASSGQPSDRPEELLPGFDLVFAKGRAALEAMAVGAALVICDAHGLGPLVTTRNVRRFRPLNFGVRALVRPVAADAIVAEIEGYDADDASQVSAWIRGDADRQAAVDRILAVYAAVLRESREGPPSAADEELRAASRYLDRLNSYLEAGAHARWEGEKRLRAETARAEAAAADLGRMRRTLTWRAREAILGIPLLARLYRGLRKRRGVGPDPGTRRSAR